MLPILGKVKKCKQDESVNQIKEKNSNPILDTRIYELEFPDGRIEDFVVSVLALNILNHDDSDG